MMDGLIESRVGFDPRGKKNPSNVQQSLGFHGNSSALIIVLQRKIVQKDVI